MNDREKVHTPRSLAAVLNPDVERPRSEPPPGDSGTPDQPPPQRGWRNLRERVFAAGGQMEVVIFRVASECFAVPLDSVREVIDTAVFHQLPQMPQHMIGVVSVAGRSLPLHDSRGFLGVASAAVRPSVLIMKGDIEDAGLVVDVLVASNPVDLATVKRVPALEDAGGALVGVFFQDGELVALLDPAAFGRLRASSAGERTTTENESGK